MSCKKAQGFLEQVPHTVKETVDAGKDRRGREAAIALARSAKKVVTGRGKNVVMFDMKTAPPDDATLAAAILGPTGNLKAPTLRIGDTLLVGFNEEAYKKFLVKA
ncbi:MAG TPA: ArsC family (seleno)protein [Gemmataceae bacterium]|nr:ArsC family (seleno)protein [Gemmataceae bacterium]